MGKCFTAGILSLLLIFGSSAAFAGYNRDLRKATRNHNLYNYETWDAKVMWHATFFSDEFRQSYDEKHIEVNYLDEADAAKFLEEEKYRQSKGWEFFISMYTKKDYKKFTNDPDSFWKIHMITGNGEKIDPLEVESIPTTPYEKVMFKHINLWAKVFRVTFPKVDLGSEFSLVLESVVGQSIMTWKVKNIKKILKSK